jgi:UDP-N-acetylglucosamine 1-carboxyvinyltransferase
VDKFIIEGNTSLKGEIPISGSKNGALPLMAAALLGEGPTVIRNVPKLKDIYTFNNVLRVTGARVDFDEDNNVVRIDPTHVSHLEAPYDLVRKMRASFYMLGALLGRHGYARVSLPGGCAWGPRPVNLHLDGLQAIGADITMDQGYVVAKADNGQLPGGRFSLNPSSVGATVNLLLASTRGNNTTIIENAAMEPDVVFLCETLNQMGADIHGLGTKTLTIHGVNSLKGVELDNAPDRIETGTFMIAAAMHPETEVTLTGTNPDHLGEFIKSFKKTGVELSISDKQIYVKAPKKIKPVSIKTQVYPGFPTDLQAQWATMMTQAEGASVVTDTIYKDRFSYVPELTRLGAQLNVKDNRVLIPGDTPLVGASVMSTDLRASVSLVMAAMIAEGESEVLRIYHLDRGYESLENKLNAVGAKIKRVDADQPY